MQPSLRGFALAVALTAAPALAQSFNPGDLGLVSQSLKNGFGFSPGVARIDEPTHTGHILCTFASTAAGAATFDPYRNGIVCSAQLTSPLGLGFQLVLVKGDASFVPLGIAAGAARCVAATGDGRIYVYAPTPAPATLQFLDAGNAVHDVLDASGTAPFHPTTATNARSMIYDAATNSLFMGVGTAGQCAFAFTTTATVLKIPLSADGTKSGGPIVSAPVCAAGATTDTKIVNFSLGPGGKLFAVVDDNSNAAVGRVVLIDTTTLAVSTYATNGPYTGAAATVAGVYSHVLDRAVIDDGLAELLRLFTLGETGSGSPWTFGDGVAAHADTTMVEIPATFSNGLVPYGSGTFGCNGPQSLYASETPTVGAADFHFTCTNAPAGALGLLIVGDVPDLAGSDPFGFGAVFHVDLFASSVLTALNINAGASGFARSPAPIPILPSFVGATVDAQAVWVWSPLCPATLPLGIASSTGLAVTFLP